MELNEYQKRAMTTCMPTSENFSYMMLNLVGEVGEFSSKVAKAIRKNQLYIGGEDCHNVLNVNVDTIDIGLGDELKKEAGDVLWQLSGLCSVLGWTLEEVAEMNLDKLSSRKDRGVIDGSGDNR